MDKEELKGLQFVLRYYSPGIFDTRKALRRYKEAHPAKERTWLRYISGIAASVAVCLFTAYYLIGEKNLLFAYILMLTPRHLYFLTVQWLPYFLIQRSVTCRKDSMKTNGKSI